MESLALKSIVAIRYGKKNPTKWLYEPHHKKTCMPNANNGTDQPAHPHSLIRTFVVHCLDSIISILAKSKISRLASFWSWAARFESCLVRKPRRQVFSWRGSYTCTIYMYKGDMVNQNVFNHIWNLVWQLQHTQDSDANRISLIYQFLSILQCIVQAKILKYPHVLRNN